MAKTSVYCGEDLDFELDNFGDTYSYHYVPVDLRDGRFGVFIRHCETRDWWRLVAVFSTWERAYHYAYVENDCREYRESELTKGRTPEPIAIDAEARTPAPETLPAEPASALISPLSFAKAEPQAEPGTPASNAPTEVSPPAVAGPTKTCLECGKAFGGKRARYAKTMFCSDDCRRAAGEKRLLERARETVREAEAVVETTAPPPAVSVTSVPSRPAEVFAAPPEVVVVTADKAPAEKMPTEKPLRKIDLEEAIDTLAAAGKEITEKGGVLFVDGHPDDATEIAKKVNEVRKHNGKPPVTVPVTSGFSMLSRSENAAALEKIRARVTAQKPIDTTAL